MKNKKPKYRIEYIKQKYDKMMDEFSDKIHMYYNYFYQKYDLDGKRDEGKWYATPFNEWFKKKPKG